MADRRAIPAQVRKNLEGYVPRCLAQGIISADASAYLLSWCSGTLQKHPRPIRYSLFDFRQPGVQDAPGILPAPWQAPLHKRHLHIEPPNDGGGLGVDAESEEEEETNVFVMPG